MLSVRGHPILLFTAMALTLLGGVAHPSASTRDRDFTGFERWRAGRPELRVAPFAEWFQRPSVPLALHASCAEGMAQRADFVRHVRHAPTRAPQLVELSPLYGSVRFDKTSGDAPVIVACALAERLPAIAAVFERHGVTEIVVNSAYRKDPDVSYHAMGLALDIQRLRFADGRDVPIVGNFPTEATGETCGALPPLSSVGSVRRDQLTLLALACDLARDVDAGLSTMLTPNYPGHADHFHIDVRPEERQVFIR